MRRVNGRQRAAIFIFGWFHALNALAAAVGTFEILPRAPNVRC